MTLHKSYPIASFKALPNEGAGAFEAIVSVIGNIDLQGDRVMSGAFDKSIDRWKSTGDPVPVLWSHDWGDPFAHIGYVDPNDMHEIKPGKASGIPPGLYVKGKLDVDKPFAKQVYDLLAERRVKEWSFSYDIPAGGEKRNTQDGANELLTVDVIEVGPTLKGANGATVTLGTKSTAGMLERTELDPGEETQMKSRLARALTMQLEGELQDQKTSEYVAEAKAGDPTHLISWYNDGADGQIDWGSPGDWQQCVDVASKYMSEDDAKGFCELRHQDATGMSTAEHAHAEGKAAPMEPMPDTPDAMRAHLSAAPPAGHGLDAADLKGLDMKALMTEHMNDHTDGDAQHSHEGMKAFDPSQQRGPNGQWASGGGGGDSTTGTTGGGGDGGRAPSGNNKPPTGGADRQHTAANDGTHPLGEGTLNNLRLALNHAGMPKPQIEALVQKMRDNFHHDGQINIPHEADKVLPTEERAKLGDEIRTEAEKRGWDPKSGAWNPPKKAEAADGAKAGRVVGADACGSLKDYLTNAVDQWAAEMNGTGDGTAEQKATEPEPAEEEVGFKSGDSVITPRGNGKLDAPGNEAAEWWFVDMGDGKLDEFPTELLKSLNAPKIVTVDNVIGTEKDFAQGYTDGSTKREKALDLIEYVRGYEEGAKDRAVVEAEEIEALKAKFAQLTVR